MTDWLNFAVELGELLRGSGQAAITHCPQCDTPEIARAETAQAEVMMIATARGISVPIVCGHGHLWQLRISSWWTEARDAAETRKKWAAQKLQKAGRAQVRPKKGRADSAFKAAPDDMFEEDL